MQGVKIEVNDIPQPYDDLTDILTVREILKLADKIKGLQIYFRDTDHEYTKAFDAICEALGYEKAVLVCKAYSGNDIYFPSLKVIYRGQLQRQIKEEYNGYNITSLAIKYGHSEKHIKNIVKGGKPKNMVAEGQMTIYDYL